MVLGPVSCLARTHCTAVLPCEMAIFEVGGGGGVSLLIERSPSLSCFVQIPLRYGAAPTATSPRTSMLLIT